MANIPIPRSDVPVVDPKTGKMNPDWYRFFSELVRVVNAGL